jgi:hypothetical protein
MVLDSNLSGGENYKEFGNEIEDSLLIIQA